MKARHLLYAAAAFAFGWVASVLIAIVVMLNTMGDSSLKRSRHPAYRGFLPADDRGDIFDWDREDDGDWNPWDDDPYDLLSIEPDDEDDDWEEGDD